VPENTGKIINAAFDFDGSGTFKNQVDLNKAGISKNGSMVEITLEQMFDKPGIYFPALRAISQREGNTETPYTRIQNIDRVRVVVK